MTTHTPWPLRMLRTITFVGVCGLVCGGLISRPVLSVASVGLALIGMSGEAVWNLLRFDHSDCHPRDSARTADSSEARA